MTETIQQLKEDIAILQEKLQKLEEQQRTKTPVEECYKDWWGIYPELENDTEYDVTRWQGFQAGYNAAYEEKVSPPEEEHKTLHQILGELDKPMFIDDVCSAVKKWIFQYDCDNGTCEDYLEGYIECQTVLEERLK